jgi:hypothetical protein
MDADAAIWADDGAQGKRDIAVQIFCWVLMAIAAPQLFVPWISPAVLAVIGLVPWALLLIVFLGNGRYLIYGPKGHTVLAGVFFLPLILGLSTMLQYNPVDWRGPATLTAGMAVGFVLLSAMADTSAVAARPDVVRDVRAGSWLGLLMAGAFLGWSTLVNINASGASLPPEAHAETIVRKWVSGGKSHTRYFNFANPPALGITDFVAPIGLFRNSATGDRVCLVIHTGVLGWRWYVVQGSGACGDPVWGKQPG